MKKVALGVLLALVVAAFPIGTASAANESSVHIIYVSNGNQPAKISIGGIDGLTTVLPSTGIDVSLPAGTYTVLACTTTTTAVTGTTCTGGLLIAGAANNLTVVGNSNYTFTLQNLTGATPPVAQLSNTFNNDLSQTGLGEARFTLNNSTPTSTFDICIDGLKVITNVTPGGVGFADLPAEQGAQLAVVTPTGGACGTASSINLVAGTNFVLTIVAANPAATALCTTSCGQVLFVGQGTVPNNPNTQAFCHSILGLAGVQPALRALVGNVNPTSTATIIATQPSVLQMTAFTNSVTTAIDAGDATVPGVIQPAWETATAGLRKLVQTFQLVGYQLSNLPASAVEAIVEGALGQTLPGIPPDPDVVAATAAITAFFTSTCIAAPTPGPTPRPDPGRASRDGEPPVHRLTARSTN